MKKSVWLVTLVAAGLALSYGCGGSSDGDGGGTSGGNTTSLVGGYDNNEYGFELLLDANGRYTVIDSDAVQTMDAGTWSTSGNRITATSDTGASETGTFTLSGNALTIVFPDRTEVWTRW